MRLEPYRRVLAQAGVRPLVLIALLARLPSVSAGLALTLYVVLDLGRGYAAAGLVGTAFTVGAALGAPTLGRLVDRHGLRKMLIVTTAGEAAFWTVAPLVPFAVLLVVAFAGGLLAIPVFSVVRQSLAALVPPDLRRPAYSLDSMSVEASFMVGPALAVLAATQLTATATVWLVGAATVLSGIALYALNPPTVSNDEGTVGGPVPRRRQWLGRRLVAVLLMAMAATFVLGGTDVAIIATLREADQLRWTGLVLAAWGAYSLLGGFVYGAVPRAVPPLALVALLAAFTVPVAVAGGWPWLCLALVPAGALCAPALASTAESVSRLVPGAVRGEAMGWYGSALTTGFALGAPAVGAVVDRHGPTWGFVAAGAAGALLTLCAAVLLAAPRTRGAAPAVDTPPDIPTGDRSAQRGDDVVAVLTTAPPPR